jgi:hypothetical protein
MVTRKGNKKGRKEKGNKGKYRRGEMNGKKVAKIEKGRKIWK